MSVTGWFTEDFTLAELRTLRAIERLPTLRPDNTAFDGKYPIPTLDEVLDLARHSRSCSGQPVGVAPETKHPTYFASIGLPLERAAGGRADRADLNHRERAGGHPELRNRQPEAARPHDRRPPDPADRLLRCTVGPGRRRRPRTYADLTTPSRADAGSPATPTRSASART